jgi:hypothetical protein
MMSQFSVASRNPNGQGNRAHQLSMTHLPRCSSDSFDFVSAGPR